MSNKLFVIKESGRIVTFYNDLEKAKYELKNIYNTIFDFKYYSYEINVYDLIDNEYIITNVSYIYKFDNFQIKNIV